MKRSFFVVFLVLMGCSNSAVEQSAASDSSSPETPPVPASKITAEEGENGISRAERRSGGGNSPARAAAAPAHRIEPGDLAYRGAFRLPAPSGGSNWEYSGYAMTYYPGGDPQGPDDGCPGSLFAVGHDHQQMVSEISIPVPVISRLKDIGELQTAETLQPFADICGGLVGELEIPRAGLEYLPSSDPAQRDKLHFCWGQHFQPERDRSHGWSELTLASPNPKELWRLDDLTDYVANDYLFEIPSAWSQQHLPGYRLATGRFRDGRWGGLGPAILAYTPPNEANPPANGATIDEVKLLLMYGAPQAGVAELEVSDERKMKGFSESDEWSGGAWLTAASRAAVILVGSKGPARRGTVSPTA